MGVLDDAIREHLDLKRKHGVSEEEVQRQEVEALGPARREVSRDEDEPAEADAVEAEVEGGELSPEADAAETAEAEVPETTAEEPAVEAELEAEAADAAPPVAEPPAPVDDSPAERADDDTVLFDAEDEIVTDPAPADAPSGDTPESGFAPVEEPAEREEPDSGATQEYDPFADEEGLDAEPEPPADAAAEGEDEDEDGEGDVLEDTPDFLQETPEHDRLWFEQKPPRDFDFD